MTIKTFIKGFSLHVVEEQEVQLLESDNDDNFPDNNKNLIDFDLYSNAISLDSAQFPILNPKPYTTQTIVEDEFQTQNIVVETLPILYPKSLNDELQYLTELNAIATTLPLYPASYRAQQLQVLIDSGASENYVSPHVIQSVNKKRLIPVNNRQVETASGNISQIEYKVEMDITLNGVCNKITAFVFPTKFDLILGRSWLKQAQPSPDWENDTWYLNNGRVKLQPCTNIKKHSHSLPKLSYLISHKQADRLIKKGGESFLFFIKSNDENDKYTNPKLQTADYWDQLVQEFSTVFKDELPGLPPDRGQHRAAAEFRLKAMAEKDKIRWDATIKKLTFELGDMVMLTHEGRYGLEPQFKGPFIVVEVFPDYGTYKLQTLAGEPLKSLVHVDRLRPAHGERPSKPWYDPTAARLLYLRSIFN
ncbi:hypothetical protein INT48_003604, partial [Thamnidium elegans]